ncbi:hypothetical protein HQQ81_02465 [Microbacteriaceae bacterium VKM Ac-2854]|nr:hypothetical protein [Microbacteriaceae bacterium VKM Ac-2854]
MDEELPRDTYGDLFRLAACLGALCGNLVWIVPGLITGGWEAIWLLPFATIIGAIVGLLLAGVAWTAIAVTGERLPKAVVAGVAVALIAAAALLVSSGGVLDPLSGLLVVVLPGVIAGTGVALRKSLRRAPAILLAMTLVLAVSVIVVASVHPGMQQAVARSDMEPGGSVVEPTPVPTPSSAEAEADARRRAADTRAAAGDVLWFAEPVIVGYPCAGSDGQLGSAVSYSFSGSFRTDPAALATDPPSATDVAAVGRISAALTGTGFVGRPFASGTASTEFVGGEPQAVEQLLVAHGGAVTSVTYVGACVDGD